MYYHLNSTINNLLGLFSLISNDIIIHEMAQMHLDVCFYVTYPDINM